jgi:hypothetical protein
MLWSNGGAPIVKNPLTNNIYTADYDVEISRPPVESFYVKTEAGESMITESGDRIRTEGY